MKIIRSVWLWLSGLLSFCLSFTLKHHELRLNGSDFKIYCKIQSDKIELENENMLKESGTANNDAIAFNTNSSHTEH